MFGFGSKNRKEEFGAIIEIGSGSVLVAIVHSEPDQTHPVVVWSYREPAALQNVDTLGQTAKSIMAALVAASTQVDGPGRKALYEYKSGAKISKLLWSISAPWSYTVTKTIHYKQEDFFDVTSELVTELAQKAQEHIEQELKANPVLQDKGLKVITNATIGKTTNGYNVENPEGETAKELSVSHVNVVTQPTIIDAVAEMQDKLFTEASCRKLSFILMLYTAMQDLLPHAKDLCLVDVTYEATEIGIVRDGILMYSTHMPFGLASLAREVAEITNVPLTEAMGYLHEPEPFAFLEHLEMGIQAEVKQVFNAYSERLSELFHETGDNLSIPRRIALHADLKAEKLLFEVISSAAKKRTKTDSQIILVSEEIKKRSFAGEIDETTAANDTALLLAAQFFHTESMRNKFACL